MGLLTITFLLKTVPSLWGRTLKLREAFITQEGWVKVLIFEGLVGKFYTERIQGIFVKFLLIKS